MSFIDLSTLLTTVNHETAQHLERLASARMRGEIESAQEIITNHLQEFTTVPIVAIAVADVHEYKGHESRREKVLRDSFQAYPINGYNKVGNEDVLLEILHADARLRAFGTMKDSIATCRRVRQRLEKSSLEDATDVEVRCLLEYYQFIKYCDMESNLITDSDRTLFTSRHHVDSEAETFLSILLEKENFRDALRFSRVLGDAPSIYKSSEALFEQSSAASLTRALDGWLHLLQVSQNEQQRSGALLRVEHIRSRLRTEGLQTPAADFVVRKIQFRKAPPQDAMNEALGYIRFADDARSHGWLSRARQCVLDALRVLREKLHAHVGNLTPASQLYYSLLHDQIRTESSSEEDSNSNALFLQSFLCIIGSSFVKGGQARMLIDYLDEFSSRYGGFDFPNSRYRLASLGEFAAGALPDEDRIRQYRADMAESRGQVSVACRRSDGIFVLTDAGSADTDWYQAEIVDTDPDQMRLNVVWVLLKWAIAEFKSRPIDVDTIATFALFAPLHGNLWTLIQQARDMVDWIPLLEPAARVAMMNIFGSHESIASDCEFVPRLLRIEEWLLHPDRNALLEARHFVLKTLWQMRRDMIRRHGESLDPADAITERALLIAANEHLLRIFPLLCEGARGYSLSDQIVGENAFLKSLSTGHTHSSNLSVEELDAAIRVGTQKADSYRDHKGLTSEYISRASLSRLMKQKALQVPATDLSPLLAQLDLIDSLYVTIRQGLSPLQGHAMRNSVVFETRIRNVKLLDHRSMYDLAIDTTLARVRELSNVSENSAMPLSTLISWVERSKTRTLLDELGFWASVPERYLSEAAESAEASEALTTEQKLRGMFALSELRREHGQLPHIQEDLERVLDSQKHLEPLDEVTRIREGHIASISELKDFSNSVGKSVLLAEYFISPHDKSIMILILKAGSEPCIEQAKSIKYPDVERWVRNNMAKAEPLAIEAETNRLRQLDDLVEPLVRHSAENDTIVVCPTRDLNHIPFCALFTDDRPLISRNPIVSCASLSLLRFSKRNSDHLRSSDATSPIAVARPVLVHALEASDHFQFYNSLTHRLNGRALVGEYISARAVTAALSPAADKPVTLMHFHGHVTFDAEEPMESCLELGSKRSTTKKGRISATRSRLTAAEIFKLRLARGALAVLIGCESGKTGGPEVDDPLGLITAFYYAGASAVISSRWVIDDADGRKFTERFYQHLLHRMVRRRNHPGGMINLAEVMRVTILDLMSQADGGSIAPYHWAAFTLNGYWMMPAGNIGIVPEAASAFATGRAPGGFTGLLNSCRLM